MYKDTIDSSYPHIEKINFAEIQGLITFNPQSLLITFANSLDPDQDRQDFGPDLDPNVCHSDSVPERFFLKSLF